MSSAVYAGSFDPWSIGHEAVLKAALDVFSEVHVLVAVNPSKHGSIDPQTRARIIATAIDPCVNWWNFEAPFYPTNSIVVATTPGLVVEYASSHGIHHLVRGLRSTTDFEAEFNLYFSNRTIDTRIQTWAVLCPPELLHCSSTYVRSVVGHTAAQKVGTTFVAQATLLGAPLQLGRLFDFIVYASLYRFEAMSQDLDLSHLKTSMQGLFTTLIRSEEKLKTWNKNEAALELDHFMLDAKPNILTAHNRHEYPTLIVDAAWVKLACGFTQKNQSSDSIKQTLHLLASFSGSLGRSQNSIFDVKNAETLIES